MYVERDALRSSVLAKLWRVGCLDMLNGDAEMVRGNAKLREGVATETHHRTAPRKLLPQQRAREAGIRHAQGATRQALSPLGRKRVGE